MSSLCGVNCNDCYLKNNCKGCSETNGHPFGGDCILINLGLCQGECKKKINDYKESLMAEFNDLKIKDMPKVTELYLLLGSIGNLEYLLPNGLKTKFLNDSDVYYGSQLKKENSERCFGIIAGEKFLFVGEYSEDGKDPEIIIYKKNNK